jgi:hypothetical protein
MTSAKQTVLKIINPLIGILFVIQAGTGIFHEAIPYDVFEKLHGISGYLLGAGVVSHVVLNWNWFKTIFKNRK